MKLLTLQEVADTMKVFESTVRRLIRRGLIAAYKVGDRGQLRVKEDDLDKYVESQRVLVHTGDDPDEVPLESSE
jgi:excisionase family DNA binding protein